MHKVADSIKKLDASYISSNAKRKVDRPMLYIKIGKTSERNYSIE